MIADGVTLDQLRGFIHVAQLGNMSRAADQMNITQPALSARITALEAALGAPLFLRGPKGMALTRAGAVLLGHAQQMMMFLEAMKADVVPSEQIDSLLRLGVAETIAHAWLPDFLRALHQRWPNMRVELIVESSRSLRAALVDHQLDLTFLMGPVSAPQIDNLPLPPFELAWFCPAEEENPEPGAHPVITFNKDSRPYRELHHELTLRYGKGAQIFTSNSLAAGFEMIASGIGVGVLPLAVGRRMIDEGRIRRFDPGWLPGALGFTASWVGEPRSELINLAALLAQNIARRHAGGGENAG